MTEADKKLYKVASSGMCKRALQLDDTAKASIIGALGGAGIGALSHALTPKDEDEDKGDRLVKNLLYGAAMGGLAGYGSKKFYDMSRPKAVKDSWAERHLDPNTSTVLGATSIGAGAVGTKKLLNKLFVRMGGADPGPIVQDGRFIEQKDLLKMLKDKYSNNRHINLADIGNAYAQYDETMKNPLARFVSSLNDITGGRLERNVKSVKIPKVSILGKRLFSGRNIDISTLINNQRNADVALAEALHRARNITGHAAGGGFDRAAARRSMRGLRSLWTNPRKVIQVAKGGRGAGKAFGVSAAAALAAMIMRSIEKDRK